MKRALIVLSAAAILAAPTASAGGPRGLPHFEIVASNFQCLGLPTTGHAAVELGQDLDLSAEEFLALREAQLDLFFFLPSSGPNRLDDPSAVEVRTHSFTEVYNRLAQRLATRSRRLLKVHLDKPPVTASGKITLQASALAVYAKFDTYWSRQ